MKHKDVMVFHENVGNFPEMVHRKMATQVKVIIFFIKIEKAYITSFCETEHPVLLIFVVLYLLLPPCLALFFCQKSFCLLLL